MSDTDYNSLKVFELKELCKTNALPVSGTKAQLIERLSANQITKSIPPQSVTEAILVDTDSDENYLELEEKSEI